MNGVVGLDYASCKVVSEALDYPWDDITLSRLRLLEQKVLAKQHNSDKD